MADLPLHVGELVHDWLQLLLAQTVALHEVQRAVVVLRLVAEEVLVATHNGLLLELDVEVLLLANVEPDRVTPRSHIDLLIHFLILLKEVVLLVVESGL